MRHGIAAILAHDPLEVLQWSKATHGAEHDHFVDIADFGNKDCVSFLLVFFARLYLIFRDGAF